MKKLIGLAGYAGVGKDAVAKLLTQPNESGGLGFQRVALADPVRELLEEVGDYIHLTDFMEGSTVSLNQALNMSGWDIVKRDSPQARQAMIRLAMGAREIMGSSIWIQTAMLRNPFILHDDQNYVVTDIRLPNEIRWLSDHRGTLIWVERPGVVGSKHVTENGLPREYADHIIENDGTLEDLHTKVREILSVAR